MIDLKGPISFLKNGMYEVRCCLITRGRRGRLFGFTLAELIVAVAILGVICGFTIPKVLSTQADSKKKALLKEDASTAQAVIWRLIQQGDIQLNSHSCGSASPLDARAVLPHLNYTRLVTNNASIVTVDMSNGSRLSVDSGNSIGVYIDYDGPNNGANLYGDDTVAFFLNDNTVTCGGLAAGKWGLVNDSPAGRVAENKALWESLW